MNDMKNSEQEKSKSATLRECPFCGDQPNILTLTDSDDFVQYYIMCRQGCVETCRFDNEDDLVDGWNTRQPTCYEEGLEEGMGITNAKLEKCLRFIRITSQVAEREDLDNLISLGNQARELLEELKNEN